MSRLMIPQGGIKIILHFYKVQGWARHLEDPWVKLKYLSDLPATWASEAREAKLY